ncbi:MAG: hypothetical protein ACK56C_02395 [Alphaproteobacteria bacterium]
MSRVNHNPGRPLNPIRPGSLPPAPPATTAPDNARMAQARAFFAAAMGQPAAPATSAAAPPVPTVAAPSASTPDAPQKYLRPGSLIDIRV